MVGVVNFKASTTHLVVDHRGSFLDVLFPAVGPDFVAYALSIVNADRALRVTKPLDDDLQG